MCIRPSYVWVLRGPEWQKQPTICRKCWRCRRNRVNDYVGRALAEQATSDWVRRVTFTYAPRDDLADKILHPHHFQDAVRSARKRGHVFRYVVVGEYGDLRGRSHFHAILFGQGSAPDIPLEQNYHVPYWPHGHTYWESPDEGKFRYLFKYVLKDEVQRPWFSLSKKPHLGAVWFAQKAKRDAHLGVLPSTFKYIPPGGSERREYVMTGTTRREYLRTLVEELGRPALKGRVSEWCALSLEKLERWERLRLATYPPEAEFLAELADELARRFTEADMLRLAWQRALDRDKIRRQEFD